MLIHFILYFLIFDDYLLAVLHVGFLYVFGLFVRAYYSHFVRNYDNYDCDDGQHVEQEDVEGGLTKNYA